MTIDRLRAAATAVISFVLLALPDFTLGDPQSALACAKSAGACEALANIQASVKNNVTLAKWIESSVTNPWHRLDGFRDYAIVKAR